MTDVLNVTFEFNFKVSTVYCSKQRYAVFCRTSSELIVRITSFYGENAVICIFQKEGHKPEILRKESTVNALRLFQHCDNFLSLSTFISYSKHTLFTNRPIHGINIT